MKRDLATDSMAGILILYMVFTHICQHFNMTESSLYSMLERFPISLCLGFSLSQVTISS